MNEKDQAERLNEKYDQLVKQKDEAIATLNSQVEALSLEKEAAEQQLTGLQQQLDGQANEGQALSVELSELHEATRELRAKHEQELSELRENLEQVKSAAQHETDELQARLEQGQESLEGTISDYESQVQALQSELERERFDAHAARERVGELTAALDEAKEKGSTFQQRQLEFDHIVSSLRGDLERAISEKAAADQIAHECRVELKEFQENSEKKRAQPDEPIIQRVEQENLQGAELEWSVKPGTKDRGTATEVADIKAENPFWKVHSEELEQENRTLALKIKEFETFKMNTENIMQGLREDLHSAMADKRVLSSELRELKIQLSSRTSLAPVVSPVEVKQVHHEPTMMDLGPSSLL